MLKLLSSTEHATIWNDSTVLLVNILSFCLFFLFTLRNSCMFWKLLTTRARPCGIKRFTWTIFATFFCNIMILIWMFTVALEILRTINRNVIKVITFASSILALDFIVGSFQKIMIFIHMIAKAFIGRSYDLTSKFIGIVPSCIHSIFSQSSIVFLILLILFLTHHDSPIISH